MATPQSPLERFVEDALGQGRSPDDIRTALAEAGWPTDQVEAALQGWSGTKWGLAVPRPRTQVSARDAFFYLTLFFSLALSVWALSFIWFELIDRWIPDAIDRRWSDGLRTPVSVLLVAFPAYFGLSLMVARDIGRDPDRRRSPVRRWITYVILFCTAVVMLIDLIVLIDHFLAGELTTRFIAKCITVALIHGMVFVGYLRMQGRDDAADSGSADEAGPSLSRLLLWIGAGVALISIVLALLVGKSPDQARAEKIDQARVRSLNQIEIALNCQWERTGKLPPTLEAAASGPAPCGFDPAWTDGISYTPLEDGWYDLCTTFESEGLPPRPVAGGLPPFGYHPKGPHCFNRKVYLNPPAQGAVPPSLKNN